MKIDKIRYGLKTMIILSALAVASLLLQISANVALFDDYGVRSEGDTNRFFGFALIVCLIGLIVSIYTYIQYKKTKR